jgi:hypothetical protein
MKSAMLFVLAAGCAAGLAVPAAAATTASAYEAGRCVVRHDHRAALALIRALPLDAPGADLAALRGTNAAACAAGFDGASALLVRGTLAQALFLADFRGFGREPNERAQLVDLNLPVQSDPRRGSRAFDLYRWGDCVVRNAAAATQRLLNSGVGTPEETGAIAALQPYMTPCMPAGVQLEVRLTEARAVFAQSAYDSMYRYWSGALERGR